MTAKAFIDGLRKLGYRITVLGTDEHRGEVFIACMPMDDPMLEKLRGFGCHVRSYNRGSVLKTTQGEHDSAEVGLRSARIDLEEGQTPADAIWEAATTKPFTPRRVEVVAW